MKKVSAGHSNIHQLDWASMYGWHCLLVSCVYPWFQIVFIPILEMSATYSVPSTTLSSFNIAMGNCPFTDDLPFENGDFPVHDVSLPEGIIFCGCLYNIYVYIYIIYIYFIIIFPLNISIRIYQYYYEHPTSFQPCSTSRHLDISTSGYLHLRRISLPWP